MLTRFQRTTPHPHNAPTVRFQEVSVYYQGTLALDRISFQIQQGEQIAVVGPNGAGKSTLFNVMVGKIKPNRGEVSVYGSGPNGHICIGYVPQRNAIDWRFPVTVRDVVMMGRVAKIGFLRWPRQEDHHKVEDAMADVKILALADRQIGELSGGQQQRVFLARALAQEAELLLLDEPFTGLDLPSQQILLEILNTLRQRQMTVLVATHDLNQAGELFDRVLLVNRRLVADGSPTDVLATEPLSQAYGSHLHVIQNGNQTLMLTDTCCDGSALPFEMDRS